MRPPGSAPRCPGLWSIPLRAASLRSWARVVGDGGQGGGQLGCSRSPPPGPGTRIAAPQRARGPLGTALHPFKQQRFLLRDAAQDSRHFARLRYWEPAASGASKAFAGSRGRAAARPTYARGRLRRPAHGGNGVRRRGEGRGSCARTAPAQEGPGDTAAPAPTRRRRRRPGWETKLSQSEREARGQWGRGGQKKPGQGAARGAERGAAGTGRPRRRDARGALRAAHQVEAGRHPCADPPAREVRCCSRPS